MFFICDKSKCSIDIPKWFLNKNRVIDTSFSTNDHGVFSTYVVIGPTHHTAASIDGVSSIWIFHGFLIFAVPDCQNIIKCF